MLGAGGLSKTLGAAAVVQPSPNEHSPTQPLCLNVGSDGIHVILVCEIPAWPFSGPASASAASFLFQPKGLLPWGGFCAAASSLVGLRKKLKIHLSCILGSCPASLE